MVERYKKFIIKNYILLLVIFILFLQIFYLNTNITNYDGVQYSLSAREWAENGINLKSEIFYTFTNYGALTEHRFNCSLLAIIPLALFIKVFGFSLLSTQVFSFICSVIIILLLKLYVRNLFDEEVSNLAIAIYSLFPINAYITCSFLTDTYSNLWILIILILFFYGYQRKGIPSYLLLISSGILTVLSTFVRQWLPAIFVINLMYIYFYFKRFDIKIFYYILGNVLGLLSLLLIAYVFTGDYLYFINIYKNYGDEISKNHFLENPLFIFQMLFHPDYYSIVFLILPFFIIRDFMKKSREKLFFISWILFLYLSFEVFLRLFINLPRYHGYLNILIIPVSIFLVSIIKENIGNHFSKVIKILLIIFVIILLVLKNIDYSNINYLYYTNLLSIRKYYFIFSIVLSILIITYYILKYKKQFSLILTNVLPLIIIFILFSLSIFSLHTILSRSYETSVMMKTVQTIGKGKVVFYNLKNSEEPFKILCTNPTLLLPYYQKLLNNSSESGYEIVMTTTIQDFMKEGYFLFVNKASSYKWEKECFNEFNRFQKELVTNGIPLTMIYNFRNYTLWKIK